jgi:recombinational DNA repair protein RecR
MGGYEEVKAEIIEEMLRLKKRRSRCSKCGKEGHTCRTCSN